MTNAQDVVTGILANAFVELASRVCECEKLRETHVRDMELARVADEVARAISEKREGEFGPVIIKIHKKFLKQSVNVWLYGREIEVDLLLSELSKAKSRVMWISSDCSEHAILEILYKYEDRYLLEFVHKNFDKIKAICRGEVPHLDFGEVPAYVVDSVKKGINTFLSR